MELTKCLLFISPFESDTHQWKVEVFDCKEAGVKSIDSRNLTKEFYLIPLSGVLKLVQDKFEELTTTN